jgi:hypothetical protein
MQCGASCCIPKGVLIQPLWERPAHSWGSWECLWPPGAPQSWGTQGRNVPFCTGPSLGWVFGLPWPLQHSSSATIVNSCLQSVGTSANLEVVPKYQEAPQSRLDQSDYGVDKSCKNDASRIPTHLWDQQILLLLLAERGDLAFLCSRLMRFQGARLYNEFQNYMTVTHGANWSGQLTTLWVEMRPLIHNLHQRGGPNGQQRGDFEEKGKAKGESKRDRDSFKDLCKDFPTKQGKESFLDDSLSKKEIGRASQSTTMGANSQRAPSSLLPHLSPAADLLRDANAGQSVVYKMCNCSWWDWTKGSTLLFWRWPRGEEQQATPDGMDPYL